MPAGLAYINPIQEHRHGTATNQGNSVIGGVVYRGARFSQLYGAYVFGDYTSGNIWILRYNGTNTVPFQRITGASSPVAFGTDPRNGDVLIAQLGGSIMRLEYNATQTGTPLPPTLADTGAFADLATLTPNAGIVPYNINVPFWSDNARKTRWFSVPDTNRTIGFNADANWSFPTGAVWIKHFELELTNGVPESARRLETRFIVRNSSGVYGVTYRWDSPTNATLVPEAGLDEAFLVHDGGTTRTQVWHYPGRAECLACHTSQGGLALGFNTPQMNSEFDYGAGPENQIAALSRVGYFSTAVSNLNTLRALANPTNTAYSLDYRVHSYVAANCSQCHQPGGPSAASWDARITTPLSQAGIINGALNNDAGDTNNRVIKPGSLANSMLLSRISRRGAGQMPPIASNELDTYAIALVSAWITNGLAGYQNFDDWQLAHFGSTNAPNAQPDADPDSDGANNTLEFLTDTDPLSNGDAWRVGVQQTGDTVDIAFPHIANRGFQVEWAPDLQTPIVWGPLDVPSNRLFFAVSNFTANVIDTITNAPARFYRVRVSEP
jgi:mono/diheme cytochrome c family protein